jgi:hypothetical protein
MAAPDPNKVLADFPAEMQEAQRQAEAQESFEGREDYKGYKMPKGMSLPQRRAWKKSIDERETFSAKASRELPRASQFLRETVGDVKRRTKEVAGDIGEFGAAAAEGVGEAIKAPFEYRAALATDPEGTIEATREFGSRVMAGDPEAVRQTAEGVSMSMVEPAATLADAELARQDLAKGDYAGAAISGASVLLPFVSAGWLKTALKKGDMPSAAKDKVADLERRVASGEVTNEMQIRLELAMIEDAHKRDYMEMPQGGTPSGTPSGGPGGGGGGVAAFKANQMGQQESWRAAVLGRYEPEKSSPKFGLADQGHHNVVEDLGPLLPEDRNLLEDVRRKYNLSETELRQLRDEYVAYGYDDFPGRSERGFDEIPLPDSSPSGGRGIDDLEGPSEEELQSMIAQDQASMLRFGDPDEYAMLMEDMRRGAEDIQQETVDRARIARSRSPMKPGAKVTGANPGEGVPEGTSRAVRRGPVRRRPGKKED